MINTENLENNSDGILEIMLQECKNNIRSHKDWRTTLTHYIPKQEEIIQKIKSILDKRKLSQ